MLSLSNHQFRSSKAINGSIIAKWNSSVSRQDGRKERKGLRLFYACVCGIIVPEKKVYFSKSSVNRVLRRLFLVFGDENKGI